MDDFKINSILTNDHDALNRQLELALIHHDIDYVKMNLGESSDDKIVEKIAKGYSSTDRFDSHQGPINPSVAWFEKLHPKSSLFAGEPKGTSFAGVYRNALGQQGKILPTLNDHLALLLNTYQNSDNIRDADVAAMHLNATLKLPMDRCPTGANAVKISFKLDPQQGLNLAGRERLNNYVNSKEFKDNKGDTGDSALKTLTLHLPYGPHWAKGSSAWQPTMSSTVFCPGTRGMDTQRTVTLHLGDPRLSQKKEKHNDVEVSVSEIESIQLAKVNNSDFSQVYGRQNNILTSTPTFEHYYARRHGLIPARKSTEFPDRKSDAYMNLPYNIKHYADRLLIPVSNVDLLSLEGFYQPFKNSKLSGVALFTDKRQTLSDILFVFNQVPIPRKYNKSNVLAAASAIDSHWMKMLKKPDQVTTLVGDDIIKELHMRSHLPQR